MESTMKCWKCGKTISDGTSSCPYCGTSTSRPAPSTEAGKALRQLYDYYGSKTLLSDTAVLINGYHDINPDDKKFRNSLKSALDVGIGSKYLFQIESIGHPDDTFVQSISIMLTEDAGLSSQVARIIVDAFDDMIGWSNPNEKTASQATDETVNNTTPPSHSPKTIELTDRKRLSKDQPVTNGSGSDIANSASSSNADHYKRERIIARILLTIVCAGLLIDGLNSLDSHNKPMQDTWLELVLSVVGWFIINNIIDRFYYKKAQQECSFGANSNETAYSAKRKE